MIQHRPVSAALDSDDASRQLSQVLPGKDASPVAIGEHELQARDAELHHLVEADVGVDTHVSAGSAEVCAGRAATRVAQRHRAESHLETVGPAQAQSAIPGPEPDALRHVGIR